MKTYLDEFEHKQPLTKGVIFSIDHTLDEKNLDYTLASLKRLGYKSKVIEETFITANGLPVTKSLIYTQADDHKELVDFVNALLIQHNQKDYLEVSPERILTVRSLSGESNVLGVLNSVSKDVAVGKSTFLHCPTSSAYFIIS